MKIDGINYSLIEISKVLASKVRSQRFFDGLLFAFECLRISCFQEQAKDGAESGLCSKLLELLLELL